MAKRTSSEFSGYSLAKSNSKKGVNKHSDDVVGKDGETSPFARGDERDINSQPYVPPIAKSLGNRLVPGADCSAYPNMGILLSMQDKNNSAIINLYLRSNISEREASSQEYTPYI